MMKIIKKNEFYVFIVILILAVVIQINSGQFFTGNNLVDIANALIVPGLFSISAFMVLLSGGIDVSFPAIASLVSYSVTSILLSTGYKGSVILPFVMAMAMGMALGAINGLFIGKMKLPALIVTLATQSIFRGILQGPLNAQQIDTLPPAMQNFGKTNLFVSRNASGMTSIMPISILFLIVFIIIAFVILRYTMLGRSIYAVGGDEDSAVRAGFNVLKTKMFVYSFGGMIAGIAGMIRVSMMSMVHPTNLFGMEMTIIAAIVLGGASIAGGVGSLAGAMLGITLLTIVQNSLILIGIPSYWQQFFTGLLIIIGTTATSLQLAKNKDIGQVFKRFKERRRG